ncbi:MAG: two-component system sensor histidine kinase NtrB [Gemmatimonadota bacterium]
MAGPLRRAQGTLDESRLLAGVYAARLAIANALAVAATVVRTQAEGLTWLPLAMLIVGIPTAWTIASVLYSRRHAIGPRFLAVQILHDLVLTTVAVLLTGGLGSEFVLIYLLLIAVSGPLLGFQGAIVTALACVAVYLGIAYLQIVPNLAESPGLIELPNLSGRPTTILWSLSLTSIVFILVGVVGGMVGRRLRVQRERLTELEQELAASRIDAQDILDTIESGILSIDADENIDFVNVTARSQLGITAVPEGDVTGGDHRALGILYNLLLQTLRREQEVEHSELAVTDIGGRLRTYGVTTTVLYDPRGRKRGAAAIMSDLDQRQRFEELARQTDRLQAMHELAAGLAHEIQNPLAAIRSAVELMEGDVPVAEPQSRRLMDLVVRESDRLAALVEDFKAFSAMRIRDRKRLDLRTVLEDAIEVERMVARADHVRVTFMRHRAPIVVEGDHNLLKQVCVNLLSNARHAVEGSRDPQIEIHVGLEGLLPELERAGRFAALEVRDNGVGIDDEAKKRIFDPFFTTRTGGFGMGLAIVHRIVELHGGMVWVDSEPGRGSNFRIALPRAGSSAE